MFHKGALRSYSIRLMQQTNFNLIGGTSYKYMYCDPYTDLGAVFTEARKEENEKPEQWMQLPTLPEPNMTTEPPVQTLR